MATHSIEVLTCARYGCPGCDYRHFHRSSDGSDLTEVPGEGMFTRERLAVLGRAALATGAIVPGSGDVADESTSAGESPPVGE